MANRPHQGYTLFQLLKAAGPDAVTSRADIAKALGVNEGSVPVYFFGLKKFFNVDFEIVKNGRSVVGYKLLTFDADVPVNGRRSAAAPKVAKAAKQPKVKATKTAVVQKTAMTKSKKTKVIAEDGSVPVLDSDMSISEITDFELADIKSQLGLG